MSPSGKGGDGIVGDQGVDEVGLNLDTGSGIAGAERSREDVMQAGRKRPDDNDLVLEYRGIDLVSQDAVIGDNRITQGWTAKIDQVRKERNLFSRNSLFAHESLVDLVSEAGKYPVLEGQGLAGPSHDAVSIRDQVGRAVAQGMLPYQGDR